jgi:hypothetical protein
MKTRQLAHVRETALPGVNALLARPFSCELRQGKLCFTWATGDMDYSAGMMRLRTRWPVRPPASLWRDFIALHKSDDEGIRRFAERFGPLRPSGNAEPTQEWRDFALLGLHLSLAVSAMREGRRGDSVWWKTLSHWCRSEIGHQTAYESRKIRKLLIAVSLSKWLSQPGCYAPSVRWRGESLRMEPIAHGVVGVVGLKLALSLTRHEPLIACSGCGTAIQPAKQASRGTRRYCPECRRGGLPARDAMRDHRRRLKNETFPP